MDAFTDFLARNYLWFLVISIVLLFALIGYFVDQREQKKGISKINKPKEPEVNIEDLQALAQNKSLNNAVSDAMNSTAQPGMQNMPMPNPMPVQNNIISETPANGMPQQVVTKPVGFDVLSK